MKSRGLETVDIFIMDGAPGVPSLVKKHFPTSDIQICTVHTMRNFMNRLAMKDKAVIIQEVKNLFYITDMNYIEKKIEELCETYPRYEKNFRRLLEIDYLFTYLKYPVVVHKAIKSTNRIEAINQKIKTRISHKRAFPTQESLEKILVATILELNNNSTRKVNGMEDYIQLKEK